MNQPQQDAVDPAFESLSEHSDHAVFVVGAFDGKRRCAQAASLTGGAATALSLSPFYTAMWTRERLHCDSEVVEALWHKRAPSCL